MEPRYVHECKCTRCDFLGYEGNYDLYASIEKDMITINTLIARKSSEGCDYYSGLAPAVLSEKFGEMGRILSIALQKAIDKGYILE